MSGTRVLTGGDLTFLRQGQKLCPFVCGECNEISLGHPSRPFWAKNTTGRTSSQTLCD